MKRSSIIVSTIIVIAIVVGTLVIVSAVSSEVFGGLSLIWLSQNPCNSLNELTKRVDVACQYNYTMKAELNIPTEIFDYRIIEMPRFTYWIFLDQVFEFTGYNPEINKDYPECRGGVCICMVDKGGRAPAPTNQCRFCHPVAKQVNEPAFCCDYGVCRFENIGNIPEINTKMIEADEGKFTRIFEGLTFIVENKTDNLTWIRNFCDNVTYDDTGPGGVYIIDYLKIRPEYNLSSGCCYKEDRLVGSCVRQEMNASNNYIGMVNFLRDGDFNYTNGLQDKVALNITPRGGIGGLNIVKSKLKLWWRITS